MTNKSLSGLVRHGDLIRDPVKGVEFVPKPKHIAKPIEDFPHKDGDDLKGCVSMVEAPFKDQRGKIPDDLYRITVDTYYKEESADLTSLWSLKVWKMDNNFDTSFMGLPVAWYAGRPTRYEDNHDITFMLSELFNAKIQSEISGGGQSLVTYAKTRRKLHMLCNEPEMAHNKELASKSAGNSFLMNMAADRKRLGLMYLEDWHVKPRGIDENGNTILNIHRIYDLAFLREMRKFNPEKGNFDRISDAIVAMFEIKENYAIQIRTRKKSKKNFYNREFYGDGAYTEETGVTTAY